MDSDVLLVSNSHVDEKLLGFLPVVTLHHDYLALILFIFLLFLLLLLLFILVLASEVALLGDTTVGLEVLDER